MAETAAGKLAVKFVVVNHSEADIGDQALKIKLVTTAAKPEDPPITEFVAKVPALGPQEVKDVSTTATTKLRIYELPDWQFIRAEVEITSPPPLIQRLRPFRGIAGLPVTVRRVADPPARPPRRARAPPSAPHPA